MLTFFSNRLSEAGAFGQLLAGRTPVRRDRVRRTRTGRVPVGRLRVPVPIALLLIGLVYGAPSIEAAEYHDNRALESTLRDLSGSGGIELSELCRDAEGRPVWLVRAGSGRPEDPAVLVVGALDGRHLIGTEMALGVLRGLMEPSDSTRALLDSRTLYVVPRVNLVGADAFFDERRRRERAGIAGEHDTDQDGRVGEDLRDDLDGDGQIRSMRVEDAGGTFVLVEPDGDLLREAKTLEGERGSYRWMVEGRDDDGDERFHEEADAGTNLARNFTHGYEWFARGSGAHQVSETETRALADFLIEHPEVGGVLVFGFEDNLLTPWPEGKTSSPNLEGSRWGRKPVDLPNVHDLGLFREFASRYRTDMGLEPQDRVSMGSHGMPPELENTAPAPTPEKAARGGFAHWVYYTRGRLALGTPVWTPALQTKQVENAQAARRKALEESDGADDSEAGSDEAKEDVTATEEPAGSDEAADPDDEAPEGGGSAGSAGAEDETDEASGNRKTSGSKLDEKVEEELAFRDWWVEQDASAWSAWESIEHPDFPGRRVEIGGYAPFVRINPPPALIDSLLPAHRKLVHQMLAHLPRLEMRDLELTSLGGGVHELSFTVENVGLLPDVLGQGIFSTQVRPTRVELGLPEGAEVLGGRPRFPLDRISGGGGEVEVRRLLRLPRGGSVEVEVISELGGRLSRTARVQGGG